MAYKYKRMRISERETRDQHRLIVEKLIGRRLNFNEVVHHVNGDPTDNSPENLKVMSRKEHGAYHRRFQEITEDFNPRARAGRDSKSVQNSMLLLV